MSSKVKVKDKKLLSTALQQIDDAVFITDTSGEILYVNSAFEKLTGFSKDEAIGKTPRIIKSDQHEDEYYDELWDTISKGEVFRKNIINKKKNGELFYAYHTITPIKDDDGEITHFVGSWKDITKQMKQEETRGELIRLVSHELKTPITTVKTLTQMLHRQAVQEGDKEKELYYGRMDIQINKLINFINDLLDVTNIEGGELRFNFREVEFDKLVQESIEDSKIYLNSHVIKLDGNTNATVRADSTRVEQVISNLLTNACKFSPADEIVQVECKRKNGKVVLLVKDKGVGIDKKEQEEIFDRYYRVKTKANKSIPGVGLGLYISSEIIKRHNGNIWVDSEPGEGSEFGFSLPIVK